jgi:hypothetical protein
MPGVVSIKARSLKGETLGGHVGRGPSIKPSAAERGRKMGLNIWFDSYHLVKHHDVPLLPAAPVGCFNQELRIIS